VAKFRVSAELNSSRVLATCAGSPPIDAFGFPFHPASAGGLNGISSGIPELALALASRKSITVYTAGGKLALGGTRVLWQNFLIFHDSLGLPE